MVRPVVSIITATYNHDRFIGQCIESVLRQSYRNWEMIVVDDGSTDQTPGVIASYKDSRIRYFYQANQGIWQLHKTYNFALEQARGDFIAILEGDDLWPKERLERQLPTLNSCDAVLSYGRFLRMDENGLLLSNSSLSWTGKASKQSSPYVLNRLLKAKLNIMPVTTLIVKKFLHRIGGFQQPPYYPAVEHPTWLNLALHGPFCYLDSALGFWRRHINQATGRLAVQLSDGQMRYSMKFFNELDEGVRQRTRVSWKELRRRRSERVANAHFSAGRYQLVAGHRGEARRLFMRALGSGNLYTKAKAGAGLLALVTGLNLEHMIARIGGERFG